MRGVRSKGEFNPARPGKTPSQVGRPDRQPSFVQPCLARSASEVPTGDDWLHEIKYDGYRLQAWIDGDEIRLITRSGHNWTHKFDGIVKGLRALKVRSVTLDGEAVVLDERGASSFADLVAELRNHNSELIVFFVFDILYLNGAVLTEQRLRARKSLLKSIVRSSRSSPIRLTQYLEGAGEALFAEVCKLGLEGVVSKRTDRPYRSGRHGEWVKTKCVLQDEFVIVGYVPSAAVSNAVGSLVVGYYAKNQLIYVGRVGTGFNRSSAHDLWKRLQSLQRAQSALSSSTTFDQARNVVWVTPTLVAQINYRSWSSDGLLRHASFVALREDKLPRRVNKPTSARDRSQDRRSSTPE